MITPRSLAVKLATAFALVLASAVPVFAANSFDAGNTSGATAASVTAPKPAGLAVGDVMIASVAVRSNSATTITPVASWNFIAKRITNSGNPDTQLSTYWKTADAADVAGASFQFNLSPNVAAHAGVARYDDVAVTAATPIANNVTNPAADGNNQNNPVRALSVTTTAPGQYVHAIYAADDDATLSTPSGMSPLYNNAQASGENGRLAAFDVSQPIAGASGNKDSTASANVAWTSQTLALKVKPTKLAFSTSPQSGVVDQCLGPITVQTQNTAGVAVNPLSSTQVNLATNETGSFFTDSSCATTAVTNGTIGTGDTGFTFYYKPTARGSGSHQITATDNAAVLPQAQQTQTVRLAQTIDWPNVLPASAIYGDSFGIGTASATPSGLPVTITPSGGCSLVGSTATVTSASTDCTLTASQAGDADYGPAPDIVRVVTTDPRPITVTADSGQSKVYNNGNSNPTYTSQVTSGNLVGSDSFTGALARAAGENVNTSPYAINQGTLSAGSNYTITFVGANFAITARPLSMNANANSKTYGNSDPALTATLSGFAPGHSNRNQAGITGTENCTRTTGESVAGSPYTISCAQGTLTAANGNYSFVAGTTANFTINKRQLSVNADPASKTYGDADPSTFPVSFTNFAFTDNASVVSGAAACTRANVGVDEDVNTYNDVITCLPGTLTAANYSFAGGTPGDFTVNKRPAHATYTAADKVYNQSAAADITFTGLTNVITADQDPGEVELTGTASGSFADASAGQNKTVTVSGVSLTGTRIANYDLVIDNPTADITPVQLTPSFTAASKTYDGSTAAAVTGLSVSGMLAGDTVSLTGGTATFASKTVGTGKTVTLNGATLSGAQAGNYSLPAAPPTTTASITQKAISGSFTAADKDFDGDNSATITGRSLSGAVAGDAVSLTGGTATFSDANPGVDKTVTGAGFALGGADAGNYDLAGVGTTTATIRQRDPGDAPPGEKSIEEKAQDLLGGKIKNLGLNLGGLGFAFAPEDQTGTLKVGKGSIVLFAIGGCPSPCTIDAAKTLVLTGQAGASAAATKKIKLKTQKLSLGANQLGVVKLKLTKKQRKAIKKAKKAKLVVKVTLTSGTESATAKKAYKLKLKSG